MLTLPLPINGCSLLTPFDSASRTTWQALLAGECITHRASVDDALLAPAAAHLDRSLRLALAAARRIAVNHPLAPDTALFCATSKGPITTALAALDKLRRGAALSESEARQITLGPGAMAAYVGDALGLSRTHTSVAACASGLHALHAAGRALWRGECDRALVLAADASLHPLFEGSFARLGVLAPADEAGGRQCAPFHPAGRGFFLAEAAAGILLERPAASAATTASADSAAAAPLSLAWLEDSWIGADGGSLLAVDPDTRSLRQGLRTVAGATSRSAADSSRGSPLSLAFVHAHATGTGHDAFELAAVRECCGPEVPVFSSKGALGHSLGAAGLVSAVVSILCHQHRRTPDGRCIDPGRPSLTLAQGFGGHIAMVRLRGERESKK